MTFPPIPKGLLGDSATVEVCRGTDVWQNQEYDVFYVSGVYLQAGRSRRGDAWDVAKRLHDTDAPDGSVLFADARHTKPCLPWHTLLRQAREAGGDMRITVRGVRYTVMSCETLTDGRGRVHHWEIGLR